MKMLPLKEGSIFFGDITALSKRDMRINKIAKCIDCELAPMLFCKVGFCVSALCALALKKQNACLALQAN